MFEATRAKHAKCVKTRSAKARTNNPVAGRPLGYMVVWLRGMHEERHALRKDHFDFAPSYEERTAARRVGRATFLVFQLLEDHERVLERAREESEPEEDA